jgi:hypothetical protein
MARRPARVARKARNRARASRARKPGRAAGPRPARRARPEPAGFDTGWIQRHTYANPEKGMDRNAAGVPVALLGFGLVIYGILKPDTTAFFVSTLVFLTGLAMALRRKQKR